MLGIADGAGVGCLEGAGLSFNDGDGDGDGSGVGGGVGCVEGVPMGLADGSREGLTDEGVACVSSHSTHAIAQSAYSYT